MDQAERPSFDIDRMLLFTTLLSALVGIGLYIVLYLTMAGFGTLNLSGHLMGRVGLFVTCGTLLIALALALTARSGTITSTSLTGSGWFLVFGGIGLLFPAFAASAAQESVPGLTGFGGVAGALFLLMAGSLLLQAERTVRERGGTPAKDADN